MRARASCIRSTTECAAQPSAASDETIALQKREHMANIVSIVNQNSKINQLMIRQRHDGECSSDAELLRYDELPFSETKCGTALKVIDGHVISNLSFGLSRASLLDISSGKEPDFLTCYTQAFLSSLIDTLN